MVKYIFYFISLAAMLLSSGCTTTNTNYSRPARSFKEESLIPWNRPADWEGGASTPLEHPG